MEIVNILLIFIPSFISDYDYTISKGHACALGQCKKVRADLDLKFANTNSNICLFLLNEVSYTFFLIVKIVFLYVIIIVFFFFVGIVGLELGLGLGLLGLLGLLELLGLLGWLKIDRK